MIDKIERLLLASVGLIFVWASPLPAGAQNASESRTFNAAVEEFDDGIYDMAEKELADFVQTFPGSAFIPEAILYQAQAALKQQKFKVAVGLLKTNGTLAGVLADQYRYRLAEAYLQSTNYQAAADAFSSLIQEFPQSNWLLAASYGEASARFRLRDWAGVIELLQQPNRTFQKESRLRRADEFAMRGALLLAEALLEKKEYRTAEAGLSQLPEGDLIPELQWHRQYLLCRVQLADQRPREALANTTNLLALAALAGERNLLAESVALQGGILEQLNQLDEAVQVYEKNLTETVPAERARQALLKISELTLAQGNVAEAARKLETFLAKRPEDASSEVVLLTLGELHLRQHFAELETNRFEAATNGLPAVTNHLQQALLDFEMVITNYPRSALVGKAQLNKGWGLWADEKKEQSQAAFKMAVDQLPHSEEQAVARFKLGEAQLFQDDYTNALLNFRSVLNEFSDLPRVKDALFDQALYQIVRASLALGDLAGANDAMKKILEWYPGSFFSDRSMLLVGQHLSSLKRPADARLVFRDLVQQFPNSSLAPEIELAIARTYVQEEDWLAAIGKYEGWLGRFGTNGLRPQVELNRAWATWRAGDDTNALALFTNLVAHFPTDRAAPRAQFWVGTFYYNHNDFEAAEKNFNQKILLQNLDYSYQARMMAGRAAVARRAHAEAKRSYFEPLIGDNNCPPDVKVEAYFALGDTYTSQPTDPANPLQKFVDAIEVFKKIQSLYPTNRLVPRALGRIGDCYFQMAAADSNDSKQYDKATNAYQRILLPSLRADVSTRSQAEVGLGLVLEKMAKLNPADSATLLDAAFLHFTNLLYLKNLADKETPDPFWLKEAGLAAGKLAEGRKQWEVAIDIYKRLLIRLPPLRELLAKRIDAAGENLRLEKN